MISVNNIKNGFKKWREKTTTSEEIHLGHYRALLSGDGIAHKQGEDPAEYIWEIIFTILNASIAYGKGPVRWDKVRQLIMEKTSGDNRIHHIWRINTYEADYNLPLKFFWPKQLNYQEEKEETMGNNQYGGRNNKRSNKVAFINEMILEYHRMT